MLGRRVGRESKLDERLKMLRLSMDRMIAYFVRLWQPPGRGKLRASCWAFSMQTAQLAPSPHCHRAAAAGMSGVPWRTACIR